jgi:hypothetical protein
LGFLLLSFPLSVGGFIENPGKKKSRARDLSQVLREEAMIKWLKYLYILNQF